MRNGMNVDKKQQTWYSIRFSWIWTVCSTCEL